MAKWLSDERESVNKFIWKCMAIFDVKKCENVKIINWINSNWRVERGSL